MADYSNFPFGDFTDAEVFALARESKELGDDEFVKACMEAIRKRLTMRAADVLTDDEMESRLEEIQGMGERELDRRYARR